MGSGGVRGTVLARIMVAGFCCCALTSCGNSITDPEPPASLSDLFGSVLLKADGSSVGIEAVQDKAVIGVYFASRSCPACGAFTPLLVSTYNELRKADKSFEIVFATADGSAEDVLAFMQQYDMAWLAIPFGSDKIMALAKRYDVEWVPTLIVIDDERKTVSKTGREDVLEKGPGAFDDWLAASGRP